MRRDEIENGLEELRGVRRKAKSLLWCVAIFSFFVNLLMLTAPLYMLQIYDRVLSSRSEETLVALSLLMAFLFLMMACFDYARGRILARVGGQFQVDLDERVFGAVLESLTATRKRSATQNELNDLDTIRTLFFSPIISTAFDIPWTPVFLLALAAFHPWLGILGFVGAAVLVALTILNQFLTKGRIARAFAATGAANQITTQMQSDAQMIRALGMSDSIFTRWQLARKSSMQESLQASDVLGRSSTVSKTFRQFLQSAMLGLGAYLAMLGEISPGAMVAGSILLGRALAPVDMVLGQWPQIQRARAAWIALGKLLSEVPETTRRLKLPCPSAHVSADSITVILQGKKAAALRNISFELQPATVLGVIGPSGSGKSVLAMVLTGVIAPSTGAVRLDGAALEHYNRDELNRYVGFLPQRAQLFTGTIADNIAGLELNPDPGKIVAAARLAGVHDLISSLPDGYDTLTTPGRSMLSGGQIQRIGLARALFDDPQILVLDEPNSNLDAEGTLALNSAIRTAKERDGAVVIMAHRPAAIQECDQLMILNDGVIKDYGPRDEIMRSNVQNAHQIRAVYNNHGAT